MSKMYCVDYKFAKEGDDKWETFGDEFAYTNNWDGVKDHLADLQSELNENDQMDMPSPLNVRVQIWKEVPLERKTKGETIYQLYCQDSEDYSAWDSFEEGLRMLFENSGGEPVTIQKALKWELIEYVPMPDIKRKSKPRIAKVSKPKKAKGKK